MFEFDPIKSEANLKKHGIDFLDAQQLWEDPDMLEIPARLSEETRFLVIGKIRCRYWSAVITYRGTGIRLISVRRARPEEIKWYESKDL